MKSMIREIYHANRGTLQTIQDNDEYFNIMKDVSKLYNEIIEKLPDDMKEQFKKFCELQDGLAYETAESHYIEGFKIGLQIGLETN